MDIGRICEYWKNLIILGESENVGTIREYWENLRILGLSLGESEGNWENLKMLGLGASKAVRIFFGY